MDQAREAIKDVYPAAAAKGIALHLTGSDTATARADPALLHIILRNILENAAKYAPAHTAVDVVVTPDDIVVRDRGPGIAEAEREKVFTRFYRVQGGREPGSGLGLSIVRAAAQQSGCEVHLFTPDDGNGLAAGIRFQAGLPAV
jgi:signal transduction histidine kinase